MSSNEIPLYEGTVKQYDKLFQQAAQMGLKETHITGGEPFIRNDLEEIVKCSIAAGLMTKVNTCGIGATKQRVEELAMSGVQWIGVPIEGGQSDTHDRGKKTQGAHEAALRAIQYAKAAGMGVEVSILLTNDNLGEMEDIIGLLDSLGVDKATTFYYSPINRAARFAWLQPTDENYRNAVHRMRDAVHSLNSNLKLSCEWSVTYKDQASLYPCRIRNRDFCMVQSDGRVYPCPLFALSDFHLGNAWEDSLDDVLNSETRWSQFVTKKHSQCDEAQCQGGCMAYAWINTGNLENCDLRCGKLAGKENLYPCCVVHSEHLINFKSVSMAR